MATNIQKGKTALQQKQEERLKNQYSGAYIKTPARPTAAPKTTAGSLPQQAPVVPNASTTQIEAPDFTTTVQERANALVQQEAYDNPRKFAEEIGFSQDDIPSSLEAQVQKLKDQQAQRLKQAEDQTALTNRIEAGNVEAARRSGEGSIAASDVSLMAGREAPTSAGNIRVASAFEKETNRRVNDLADQASAARAAREAALQELKLAQQEQRADLILSAKNRLANAETEIKKIDTDLLNAQQAQSQEARAIQEAARANFNSFTGVIDSGIQLDTSGVRNLATSLNIPFELALDYYDGAKQIRDDKALSQEEKALGLQDLRLDLDRKKKGLDDVKARQIDYLSTLRKSGANPADISAYKELVGITDYDDPLTKADLEIKQLEAKIKQNQLNGVPTSIAEQEQLFELRQKQRDLSGEGITAYVPEISQRSTNKGISVNIQNGLYDITAPVNYQAWCGEFVNDVWGVGVFGDRYSDKQSQVTKNGILTKEIKDPFNEIVPGMAFVMPIYDKNGKLHSNGHTGIVTGVSPDGLSVYTRETNADGNYKGSPSGSGTNITNQIRSIQSIYGFVRPPKATLVEAGLKTDDNSLQGKYAQIAKKQGLQGKAANDFVASQIKAAYSPLTEAQSKSFDAYTKVQAENAEYEQIGNRLGLQNPKNLENFANKINVITRKIGEDGLTPEVINRNIQDSNLRQAILSEMRWIEGKLRKESGAVITKEEYTANGTQYFPRAGDDAQTLQVKAQRRAAIEKGLRGQIGPAGERIYEETFGQAQKTPTKVSPVSTPTLSKYNIQVDLDTLIDE